MCRPVPRCPGVRSAIGFASKVASGVPVFPSITIHYVPECWAGLARIFPGKTREPYSVRTTKGRGIRGRIGPADLSSVVSYCAEGDIALLPCCSNECPASFISWLAVEWRFCRIRLCDVFMWELGLGTGFWALVLGAYPGLVPSASDVCGFSSC